MRVLFVTPYLPALTKPRPHHFIRELVRRGHEVHVVALESRGRPPAAPDQPDWADMLRGANVTIVEYGRRDAYLRCVGALPSRTALRVAFCAVPALLHAVDDVTARLQPDVVHVDRERLGPTIASLDVPKVLDATDSISLYNGRVVRHGSGVDRLLALIDLPRMRRTEATMGEGYGSILVAAAQDAAVIAKATVTPVLTIPNGVSEPFLQADRRPVGDRLVFVGNLSYPPNIDAVRWFTKRVLPSILERRPNVQVHLVGTDPGQAIRSLARLPGVRLIGPVPDVVPHLEQAAVAVAPLRIGGGFPNKVAEALAASVPLVSTAPACAGIPEVVDGVHARFGEGEAALAAAVLDVLGDLAEAEAMARRGRSLIQERYRWDVVGCQLEAAYEDAIVAWRP